MDNILRIKLVLQLYPKPTVLLHGTSVVVHVCLISPPPHHAKVHQIHIHHSGFGNIINHVDVFKLKDGRRTVAFNKLPSRFSSTSSDYSSSNGLTRKGFHLCLFTLLLFAYPTFLLFRQGTLDTLHIWSLVIMASLTRLFLKKPVKKESVLILPALEFNLRLSMEGTTAPVLEWENSSGSFVPISRILKPVLTECVTPVTCYWSLSLIIRGEEELMLVFELRPPVKMLAPIWKAYVLPRMWENARRRLC
ncbi:hypothetical protein HAX54_007266 [Datura stramonium]|uniref:Phosphatidylinositol N-acetylglucosaminyltransferase subunit H conserved domain-containing protein n=1 Tax=Datura stramonium TaxID=4076 RepID=A0ABS8TCV0_DATST|nr:hypothetical protein [Datura stramonium]